MNSRSLSRSKKALSTSLVLFWVLKENAKIQFIKAKQSKYALKVLIGKTVQIDQKTYSSNDFAQISMVFCEKMKLLIEREKSKKTRILTINRTVLESIRSHKESVKDSEAFDFNQINDCRNREAAFSNFLSFVLVQRGYSLCLNLTTLKESSKVMHFYVWEKVVDPSGEALCIKQDEIVLRKMVENIQVQNTDNLVVYGIGDVLPHLCTVPVSAFVPVDERDYQILSSFNGVHHPFQ
ncbi:hypothetical protein EIN_173230 [Entamoeba invadens IP1]|uniref:Uncharacterized protein n=1 Tax=Entamoeba invadens IP1 TaxID=370355 RepID=A0A0A1U175_ENTIV|nr:hypothetical protein EIN_173230 [Entamoeba invadens IP1]ELP84658.1 hypothetical protein EIN_173230 [Entamoeba invadens IP1]|eukprot:XP_004184004.1 hypothetical protein EIN_173230 [Entamoeba invadens IP1]